MPDTRVCADRSLAASLNLHNEEAAALRWIFQQRAGADGRLSIDGALKLLHELRAAWKVSKMDAQFRNLSQACDAIDRDGHLTLPELGWLLHKLHPEHIRRVVLIHTSMLQARRALSEARGEGRS